MQKPSYKRTFSAACLSLLFLWVQVLAFSKISEPVRFQFEKEQIECSVQSEDAASPLNSFKYDGTDREKFSKVFSTAIPDNETCCSYVRKFRFCLDLVDKITFVRSSLYKWHHAWKFDLV
jgi:hypothetical protein